MKKLLLLSIGSIFFAAGINAATSYEGNDSDGNGGYYYDENRPKPEHRLGYWNRGNIWGDLDKQSDDSSGGNQGWQGEDASNRNEDGQVSFANTAQTTPGKKRITDGEISRNLLNIMQASSISKGYPNVRFNVVQGHVTLTGTVDNESDKSALASRVKAVQGIVDVQNQVQVQKKGW